MACVITKEQILLFDLQSGCNPMAVEASSLQNALMDFFKSSNKEARGNDAWSSAWMTWSRTIFTNDLERRNQTCNFFMLRHVRVYLMKENLERLTQVLECLIILRGVWKTLERFLRNIFGRTLRMLERYHRILTKGPFSQ